MSARFPRKSRVKSGKRSVPARPGDDMIAASGLAEIPARACCCTANPVLSVALPPTPQRPHTTDLLFCGHHYRVYRDALAAAYATVYRLPGVAEDMIAAFCWRIPAQRRV